MFSLRVLIKKKAKVQDTQYKTKNNTVGRRTVSWTDIRPKRHQQLLLVIETNVNTKGGLFYSPDYKRRTRANKKDKNQPFE